MRRGRELWTAILLGGFIAGTVDIGAAALIAGQSPLFILHVIAGGLMGKAAISTGGAGIAVLGLVLQWGMSILIAAIYAFVVRRRAVMAEMWVPTGFVFGVAVFLLMNYVVVPLSAYRRIPHFSGLGMVENMAAMALFGLIVAYCARRTAA